MNQPVTPLQDVQQRIAYTAHVAGREPADIRLIAISKTHPVERILPLVREGQCIFGENRVQEAYEKWPDLLDSNPDLELHLVGQLQSNKAEDAVALFDCIHSLDRPSLLTALAKAMNKQDRRVDCLVQVDIGEEAQKGGCPIAEVPALLEAARVANVPVVGLMCVPPAKVEPAPYFALLAQMAADHGLPELSMGMSSDFETAVMLGATYVRVGSALFGAR